MPENEFEKQVQIKMDGLKLRPSEPVWEKIEAEIHDRKRRRLFFMLSLTAAALLFGWLGYSYFYADTTSKHPQQETALEKRNADKTNTTTEANDKNSTIDLAKEKSSKENITTEATNKKEVVKDNAISPTTTVLDAANDKVNESQQLKKAVATTNKNHLATADKLLRKNKKFATGLLLQKKEDKPVNVVDDHDVVGLNEQTNYTDVVLPNLESSNLLTRDNNTVALEDFSFTNSLNSIVANNSPAISFPAIASPKPLQFSRKLKFGLTVAGGISSRTKEPFEFTSSAEKSAVFTDVSQNYFGIGNASGGVLVLPPSEVKPGATFKAGVIVEKPLSRRFTISSGIQYAYSSDHISIGKPLSGTLSPSNLFNDRLAVAQTAYGGNAGVEKRDYTNKYHFVELPVMLHYTINKRWKNPFVWNAGASIGRLVSTNVLLYDAAYGGIYYDGKDDIKKTQVNLFTGFAWRFTINRLQWSVGPQVAVNTTKLFDNPYDNNLHPVSGSINLRVLFPGKKK